MPKGRHWAAWIGNCDCPNAILLAAKSDDGGKTWSRPCLAIDTQSPKLPVPRTVILGNFRTDPTGRLWLFFDRTMNHHDGRGSLGALQRRQPPDIQRPGQNEGTALRSEVSESGLARTNSCRKEKRTTLDTYLDGTIYITYDHNRGPGEVTMAKFTEEDVLAGKIVNPDSRLKMVVVQPKK